MKHIELINKKHLHAELTIKEFLALAELKHKWSYHKRCRLDWAKTIIGWAKKACRSL